MGAASTASRNGTVFEDLRDRLLAGEVVHIKSFRKAHGVADSTFRTHVTRIRRQDGVDIQAADGRYQIVPRAEEPPPAPAPVRRRNRPRGRDGETISDLLRRRIMSGEPIHLETFAQEHATTYGTLSGYIAKLRRTVRITSNEGWYQLEQVAPEVAEAEIAERAKKSHPDLGPLTLVRLELVGKRTIGTIEDGRGGSWRVTF